MKTFKHILLSFSALMLTFALILPQPAEAKRFGGGGSFGKQYSKPAQQPAQRPQPAQQQQQAAPGRQAAPAASGASRWLGPLAGLAAGGLLAAMLFGDGFDGLQFMDILLFGLLAFGAFMLFKHFRSRQAGQGTMQPAGAVRQPMDSNESNAYRQAPEQDFSPQPQPSYNPNSGGSIIGSALGINALHNVESPSWFNADTFVEGAKQHFVAVQKAWDNADASEIESYCTPELFAELQNMMKDMVGGENFTEVDTLHSELVDQSFEGDYFIVSIRFSGFIKESKQDEAHAFNEIWHIRRLAAGEGNWLIAGIQQSA